MSSISSKLWCFSSTIHCRKVICADNISRSRTEAFSGLVKRTLLTQMDSLLSHHGKCDMSVKHINPLQSSFSKTLSPDRLAGFRNSSPLSCCSVYCFDRKNNKLLDYNGQLGRHLQQLDKYCTYQKDKGHTKSQERDKNIGDILEKENVFTVPNMLTMSRIVLTPFLGYLVLQEYFAMATGIFLIAGVTDLLDGYIARNFKNQTSAFGSFLDPLADKLLVSVLYVSLTMVHLIPVPLAVLVILRDVLLITGAFYVRYISLPAPRTLSQYFNATKASAELKPLFISKLNTALQLFLVAVSLTAPVFDFVNHPLLQFLWYATAVTTVASGAGYTFAKGTFRELRKKNF